MQSTAALEAAPVSPTQAAAPSKAATAGKAANVASAAGDADDSGKQHGTSIKQNMAKHASAAAHGGMPTVAGPMQPSNKPRAPKTKPASASQAGGLAAVGKPAKAAGDVGNVGKPSKRKREGPVLPRSAKDIYSAQHREQVRFLCRAVLATIQGESLHLRSIAPDKHNICPHCYRQCLICAWSTHLGTSNMYHANMAHFLVHKLPQVA